MSNKQYYKKNRKDLIWWLDTSYRDGLFIFSFDKKTDFDLFRDYPYKLTPEQKKIFDRENPFWKDFFSVRS